MILQYYKCQIRVVLDESERKKWLITKQTASLYIQITTAQLCTSALLLGKFAFCKAKARW